ncbi:MAG: sugar phosphate nucleotidyltransferase [Candidatus Aerophobetes bacterium]|nr:sugar phosphate nucleotidyltransferase [Candidatus Aerophobetes bacterium]
MENVKAVVLAAGQGTRMRSGLIKLVHSLDSQALVSFPVNACLESGIKEIIVVVGYQADKVKSILGEDFKYAFQDKRLGTGDALKRAIPLLKDFKGELVVIPGDAPFVTPSTIIKLVNYHQEKRLAATILTTLLVSPGSYGRIIRNGHKQVKKIVESKDATPEEIKIQEVNSGIYCFDTQKLLPLLSCIDRNNAGGEYYLTDIVELLSERKLKVHALLADEPDVVLGINTPEELKRAWKILKKKKKT